MNIEKNGYTLRRKTGEAVQKNEIVTSFRGEQAVIIGGSPPHRPSSSGRVLTAAGADYYPTVYDLKWVKD